MVRSIRADALNPISPLQCDPEYGFATTRGTISGVPTIGIIVFEVYLGVPLTGEATKS